MKSTNRFVPAAILITLVGSLTACGVPTTADQVVEWYCAENATLTVCRETTTAGQEVWGVFTGSLKVSFPLSGGPVTVNAAVVRLDDGQVVEASVPKRFADLLFGGARTRVVPSSGEYAWAIVEVEDAPTTTTSGG